MSLLILLADMYNLYKHETLLYYDSAYDHLPVLFFVCSEAL